MIFSNPVGVILVLQDGRTIDLIGNICSMSWTQGISGNYVNLEISAIIDYQKMLMFREEETNISTKTKKQKSDWECKYCGQTNHKDALHCGQNSSYGCGGMR